MNPALQRAWINPSIPPSTTLCTNQLSYTIMSYNILAQSLVRRDQFPYCSKLALKMNHRKQNIIQELLHYSPDIVCLQECESILYNILCKQLTQYKSQYIAATRTNNDTQKLHGIAILYKHSIFEQVDYKSIMFNDEHTHNIDPASAEYMELGRNNVAQIILLRPLNTDIDGYGLCVTNTHLFYHPQFNYTRLLQANTILQYVQQYNIKFNYCVMYCGDLNTTPDDLLYKYLVNRYIDESQYQKFLTPERQYSKTPTSVEQQQLNANKRLYELNNLLQQSHTLPVLQSSYAHYTHIIPDSILQHTKHTIQSNPDWCLHIGEPPFTNYTQGWKGCLDYIMTVRSNDHKQSTINNNNTKNDMNNITDQLNQLGLHTNGSFTSTTNSLVIPCCDSINDCTSNVFHAHHSMSTISMLQCNGIMELPAESIVNTHIALPNEQFSSDHLFIAAKYTLMLPSTVQ